MNYEHLLEDEEHSFNKADLVSAIEMKLEESHHAFNRWNVLMDSGALEEAFELLDLLRTELREEVQDRDE